MNAIEAALNLNPELRFGQALFNWDIDGFVDPDNPADAGYRVRDIYGNKDPAIIERIYSRREWVELQGKTMTALEKPELKEIGV